MPLMDRRQLLAQTNLVELVTEICGPPRGHGRSARWHCPNPDHPDRTPSMGIYTSGSGDERWKCHACGEGGTAVDLLMISANMNAGDALRDLAHRAGLDHPAPIAIGRTITPAQTRGTHAVSGPASSTGFSSGSSTERRSAAAVPTGPMGIRPTQPGHLTEGQLHARARQSPDPAIERIVTAAAELLWQPVGRYARRYLARRGFPDELLREQRVGFDPGPAVLLRPAGLPRRGPGIVFPALDPTTGAAVYYQLRALSPDIAADRKYDQPTTEMAANPRLVALSTAHNGARGGGVVAICEGFPDAYTAHLAGVRALALLGIGHAGPSGVRDLANRITSEHPATAYTVCFDNEARATQLAYRLGAELSRHGVITTRILPPDGIKDLNTWWQAEPHHLTQQLSFLPMQARRALHLEPSIALPTQI